MTAQQLALRLVPAFIALYMALLVLLMVIAVPVLAVALGVTYLRTGYCDLPQIED